MSSTTADDSSKSKFQPPPRPESLRSSVLCLHAALAAALLVFVGAAEILKHPIPEGKFEKKDGTLINIKDFDPVELGPYPKCHPHHGEYEQVDESGAKKWVQIKDAPSAGPFPPGHPENPEFTAKRDAEAKQEAKEEMLTWRGLQPTLHLLALATLCVYLGSKHGVWMFTEPQRAEDEDGTAAEAQTLLKKEDALWFPVMGSALLFGLFVVYKYLGSDSIKLLISCYILFMCMLTFGANVGNLVDVARGTVTKPLFRVPYFDVGATAYNILGSLVGGFMCWGFIATKNWIINNVFGISFCLMGLKKIATSNFKTGCIMLVGLFLYDIFWVFGSKSVFGSNVMVTVAKGVEAPIKLMFPRSINGCGQLEFSMLGLGDIVVPGIYVAFLAKWDAVVQGSKKATSFVYLNACMFAYFLSLITTVAVMLLFNAAQPALLYIVPYVMVASALVALSRGEFGELWAYEIPDQDEEADKAKAAKAQDEKDK
uniref:Signal peptide peptidase n=1 Tax=Alexandrium monilatum TaxID=311494 RepID=A0A7S4RWT5_9DINO|mmetsp:Transcript_53187/g.158487  ORF Transcript_53187/g.158487 Transcript_53187/m.158487 type:complete len:484 (+) Transcript_53187:97-1548(+)